MNYEDPPIREVTVTMETEIAGKELRCDFTLPRSISNEVSLHSQTSCCIYSNVNILQLFLIYYIRLF